MSARKFLGPAGGVLLTIGAIFSTTGTNSALMLVTPRVLFAMSEGGQLPRIFSRVHPVFRTPSAAIVASAILGGALAMYSGFASLVAISSISRLLTYIATSAALPVLRRKMPDAQRWFSVPGGVAIPICAVALSIWLLTGSTKNQIEISGGALLAGALVYACYRKA
jgi:amino acid transporter